MNHFRTMAAVVFLALGACGSTVSGTSPSGGASGFGGTGGRASGGVSGTGGPASTGGSESVGGATGDSGPNATGGAAGSGGSKSTTRAEGTGGRGSGGAEGTGGRGSGGAASTGGPRSTGGAKGTGGATGSGGSSALDGGTSGLPYKGVANSPCAVRKALGVSWYYNWTWSPDTCAGGGEFVPMYSNKPNNHPSADSVAAQIDKLAKAGYRYVLGFNEPNKSDQANMTVAEAIALWPAMTRNPDILVGSPATSGDGQSWFEDFLAQAQAQNLRIDFIALHWYGWNSGSCDAKAASLESYIKWAEGLPGALPLWLTEWGCMNASNPDEATVQAFYLGAVAMLAKHPRVQRYAWYPWNTNNHVANDDGSLTSLGTVFAAQPSTR